MAGEAVVLHKAGSRAAFIGGQGVAGRGGLVHGEDLFGVDRGHLTLRVHDSGEEADLVGKLGRFVALAGALPLHGLLGHGQLAGKTAQKGKHAVGVMDDALVVEDVDDPQDDGEHQQHREHAHEDELDAQLADHGISSSE